MSKNDPRGSVIRVYTNASGDVVALIRWYRGTGPAQAIGQFRDGQSVKMRGAEVVPA